MQTQEDTADKQHDYCLMSVLLYFSHSLCAYSMWSLSNTHTHIDIHLSGNNLLHPCWLPKHKVAMGTGRRCTASVFVMRMEGALMCLCVHKWQV